MAEPETPNDANEAAEPSETSSVDGASREAPAGGESAPAAPEAGPDPRIAELESLLVHLKADFDNYKKRTQKELLASGRTGELEAVKRFLPALSNLERALAAATQAPGDPAAIVEGLRQVVGQFQGILASLGVERIAAVGVPFNPTLHDAVAATASPDVPPGTVTDEYEPGYSADGKALIPAKVRVATAE